MEARALATCAALLLAAVVAGATGTVKAAWRPVVVARWPGAEDRGAGLEPLFPAAADEEAVELEVRRRVLQARRNPILYKSLAPDKPGLCTANCAALARHLPYTPGTHCNKYYMCR